MQHKSLEEVHGTIDTTRTDKWWKRLLLFVGPAFLVCVGYMDPGNWATDIAGGSAYGYSLLWVLILSNLIALLLQGLSARLGIVRGKDLAQVSRETYPRTINISLYILAEIAIAACDLAEVLGMAIGLNLLFGLPMLMGVSLAILDTLLVLYLQRKGMRYIEVFIFSLVTLIGLSFIIELLFAKPHLVEIFGGIIPNLPDDNALYIAIGIIGATVMPHNLYLHSSLVQTRRNKTGDYGTAQAIKYNLVDSAIALNLAFFVNAAILILAATVFFKNGYHNVVDIGNAHHLLEPLLGKKLAPMLFAIALIASGQSSTITGTLAGQIVMEGYLDLRIAPWLRRLITRLLAVLPAFFTILLMGESKVGALLILSQVVLSLQLGFAVIPLLYFVSDKVKMGKFAIGTITKIAAWFCAFLIVFLNLKLVFNSLNDWKTDLANHLWIYNFVLLPIVVGAIGLLMYLIVFPWFNKSATKEEPLPHGRPLEIPIITRVSYKRIGICLDFSTSDLKAITAGIAQGTSETEYHLIHVVESAGARTFGDAIGDYETHEDWKNLLRYGNELRAQGYHIHERLGFGEPRSIIPNLAEELQVELLVMAGHGHRGIKDFIYGETIIHVKHLLKMPVLVV